VHDVVAHDDPGVFCRWYRTYVVVLQIVHEKAAVVELPFEIEKHDEGAVVRGIVVPRDRRQRVPHIEKNGNDALVGFDVLLHVSRNAVKQGCLWLHVVYEDIADAVPHELFGPQRVLSLEAGV